MRVEETTRESTQGCRTYAMYGSQMQLWGGIEVDTWVCDENGWAGRGKKFGNWSMSKLRRLCRKNDSGDPLQIKSYYDAIYQDLYPKALESLEACIRTVSRLQSKRG